MIRVSNDMVRPFCGGADVAARLTKINLMAKFHGIDNLASFISLYLDESVLALYIEIVERGGDRVEVWMNIFTEGPLTSYGLLVKAK